MANDDADARIFHDDLKQHRYDEIVPLVGSAVRQSFSQHSGPTDRLIELCRLGVANGLSQSKRITEKLGNPFSHDALDLIGGDAPELGLGRLAASDQRPIDIVSIASPGFDGMGRCKSIAFGVDEQTGQRAGLPRCLTPAITDTVRLKLPLNRLPGPSVDDRFVGPRI